MKKLFLLFLLLLAPAVNATVLSGNLTYPNGSPVTGLLYINLERRGLSNVCVSPAVIVSTAVVIIPVVGGAITGSPDMVPTDCLSSFQPYLVILRDRTHAVIIQTHWYITQPGGGQVLPLLGDKWVAPAGLALVNGTPPLGNIIAFQMLWPAGFQIATTVGASVLSGQSKRFTLSWPKAFPSSSYTIVCTAIDTFNTAAALNPSLYISSAASPTPIANVTPTGFSVSLVNNDMSNTRTATITCRGSVI